MFFQQRLVRQHRPGVVQMRGVLGQLGQLHGQALGQVAAGHAHRVELLQPVQDCHHFIVLHRVVRVGDFVIGSGDQVFQGHGDEAALVQGFNDDLGDHPVPVAHRRQVELPLHVADQGVRVGVALLPGVGVLAFAAGAALAHVEVVPVAVGLHRAVHQVFQGVAALHVQVRVGVVLAVIGAEILGAFLHFQQRVGLHRLLDLQAQVQRRQLQQADCLLQLGRHGQLLADLKL